jgi:hypothetical protein
MILKRDKGELTPYWAPMAANNEQIRGADDPWVVWVRHQLARIKPSIAPARGFTPDASRASR